MDHWEVGEGPAGSGYRYSRAAESSSGESKRFLSAHSSGGAVASTSFSGAWSCTSHVATQVSSNSSDDFSLFLDRSRALFLSLSLSRNLTLS